MSVTSFTVVMKDMYPLSGTRMKQWVVETWRGLAWERETCPRIFIPVHDDNTGIQCRESGPTQWTHAEMHDCCAICNEMAEGARRDPPVVQWLAERAARPPVTPDRETLSDEIAPDISLRDSPFLKMLKR